MDMNDVILSIGGVSRISAKLEITASDAEIAAHLATHCSGENIPTVAQVRAQIPVYQAARDAAAFESSVAEFAASVKSKMVEDADKALKDYCRTELTKVKNGTRTQPTVTEMISELPANLKK